MEKEAKVKMRVLLVDDDRRIVRFISLKLHLEGYEVLEASSGRQALELAKSQKPDIMLLDIIMPDMDGYEVLQKLRFFSNLPVIVISALPDVREKAINLGASDLLVKPFNPDELIIKIQSLLGK